MAVIAVELHVADVHDALDLLHRAYGWTVTSDGPQHGELDAGGLRVRLTTVGLMPWSPVSGVVVHQAVDDVDKAVQRAVEAGAELLLGPMTTRWGTEEAHLGGPGSLVVSVTRDLAPGW